MTDALDHVAASKPREKVLERALLLANRDALPSSAAGWTEFVLGPLDEATRAILGSPAAAIVAEALAPLLTSIAPPPSGRVRQQSEVVPTPPDDEFRRHSSGARRLHSGAAPVRATKGRKRRLDTLNYNASALLADDGELRVLVVDDDPSYRSAIARLLDSRGYEVSTAPDRRTALWMIERITPHLVLSDYELNDGGTGMDLARSLKTSFGAKAAPVIVVTGSTALPRTNPDVVAVLPKGGADDLLAAVGDAIGLPPQS